MTHRDEFIERLETYLDDYEGVTPLPDAVRDAIRAELPHTKQTDSLGGRSRFLSMTLQLPAPARYGLVAAAVLVAVVIGASLFSRGGSVGGPSASPSPSPSASLSPPSPTAAPTAPGPWSLLDSPGTGNLPAGDYYVDIPAYPARIDFSVPEGWWHFWPGVTREASDVHAILVDSLDTGAANGSGWGFSFAIVDEVRVDPCDSAAGVMDPSVTQSADALATAFGTWADFPATVADVTIGGYSGKRVEITRGETFCLATAFYTPAGYQFDLQESAELPAPDQFTFLDVEDSVLVIWTTDFPATTPFEVNGGASPDPEAHVADQVELHDILDSVVIEPR
jgi:hypothetical protein